MKLHLMYVSNNCIDSVVLSCVTLQENMSYMYYINVDCHDAYLGYRN